MDSRPAPAPAGPSPVRPARWGTGDRWSGGAELRADLRSSLALAAALLLAGVPAGLLWWALAPRATFEITEEGPVPVGRPSAELLVADDAVYTLVLAGLGLVAGLVAWRLRRRRGVAIVLALAVGTLLAALVAWQLGELLGAGPTPDQLTDVGTEVVTPLRLSSMAALSVAPFLAVLGYVVSTLLTPAEDLDRPDHVCAAVQPADASLSREVGPVQGPAGPPQDPAASSRVAGGRGPSPSSRSAGR